MKKITGAISLIGSVLLLGFFLFIFFEETLYDDEDLVVLLSFALAILLLSVIHYTLATRFWSSKGSAEERGGANRTGS